MWSWGLLFLFYVNKFCLILINHRSIRIVSMCRVGLTRTSLVALLFKFCQLWKIIRILTKQNEKFGFTETQLCFCFPDGVSFYASDSTQAEHRLIFQIPPKHLPLLHFSLLILLKRTLVCFSVCVHILYIDCIWWGFVLPLWWWWWMRLVESRR